MTLFVVGVFFFVYVGMILGKLPFLKLDRTGIALLGAIVLVGSQYLSINEAYQALHLPTLTLLFSFMVISAQLRLSGFYAWVARRICALDTKPPVLLGAIIATAAGLSAVFSNDVICLAMAPVLAEICLARRLHPIPFLIGLSCAANIGSGATLIGNPQNMLIGQTLNLSFLGYVLNVCIPIVLSLIITWVLIVAMRPHRTWNLSSSIEPAVIEHIEGQNMSVNVPQTVKGLFVCCALFIAFLFSSWPHELMALTAAGLLLASSNLHSNRILGLVDWPLLLLFVGLFVVNHAIQGTGLPAQAVTLIESAGFDLSAQTPLLITSFILSNVVSNVPAVMLLLPTITGEKSGTILALSSTLAGNLVIIGSIANIIVVNEAARKEIKIDWFEHARLGVPITLTTMAITSIYLWG